MYDQLSFKHYGKRNDFQLKYINFNNRYQIYQQTSLKIQFFLAYSFEKKYFPGRKLNVREYSSTVEISDIFSYIYECRKLKYLDFFMLIIHINEQDIINCDESLKYQNRK